MIDIRDVRARCANAMRNTAVGKHLQEALDEIERLRAVIQFARDKCVCRTAGNEKNPFAYLWKRDWDEFERMAEAAKEE